MKDFDKNKESFYLRYWDINNLYGWAMSQLLPVNFKWVENTSWIIKYFIENYNENGDEGNFLEVDVKYPGKLYNIQSELLFLPTEWKLESWKNFGK